MLTDLEIESLTQQVAKEVMKIVNKHHGQLKKDVADYRKTTAIYQDR